MTDAEAAKADKLIARIQELREEVDGVQIITTFIKRRVQPLQTREHTMWMYSGSSDPTRVSKEEFSTNELERSIKAITRLREEDPLLGEPSIAPFGGGNGLPKGHVVLNYLLPVPEGFMEPEDEEDEGVSNSPILQLNRPTKQQTRAHASGSAPQKSLKKTLPLAPQLSLSSRGNPDAEPKETSCAKPKGPSGAKLKGILDAVPLRSAPPVPPTKWPCISEGESEDGDNEFLLASHSGAYWLSSPSSILRLNLSETSFEVDELKKKKKLEALEEESREALDRANTEAKECEKKCRSDAAARENGLDGRLRALAAKLSGAVEAPLDLSNQVRIDSLTDTVAAVGGCGDQVQELLARLKGALKIFHENMLPEVVVPQALEKLVELFCAEEDPLVDFSCMQAETGARVALAVVMAHGIDGDFQKATESYPTGADCKEINLKPFAKKVKKYAR
ncbi:hypothetical protein ACQ4PT_039438 [Festuca glaucescens]